MLPLLEPYLACGLVYIRRETLTAALKAPLTRDTFNLLLRNHAKKQLDELMLEAVPALYADQPLYDGVLSYIRCIKFLVEDDDKKDRHRLAAHCKPPRLYSILVEPTVRHGTRTGSQRRRSRWRRCMRTRA